MGALIVRMDRARHGPRGWMAAIALAAVLAGRRFDRLPAGLELFERLPD